MPITDLTGYQWVCNSTTCSGGYGRFDIEFDITGFEEYDISELWIGYIFDTRLFDFVAEANSVLAMPGLVYIQVGNIITFTGGTDATNSTLIAWLEANGTLTAPIQANTYNLTHTLTNLTKGNITLQITPDTNYTYPTSLTISNGTIVSYDNTTGVAVISGDDTTIVSGECVEDSGITDLTGTTWEITDAPNMLGYKDEYGLTYYINFLSNNNSYSSISNTDQIERWQKLYYSGNAVYSTRTGWSDEAYRTIEITGGTDATNSDLIAWLQANATQIS